MKKASIWIIVLIIVLLIPGIIRSRKSEQKKTLKPIPVVITTAKMQTVNKWISFSSTTKGINQALAYAKLPGRFIRFVVKEGQYIKKDDIIAYIERKAPGVEIKPIPIKSPINGVVSLFPFNKGQVVKTNIPVAQVASIDKIRVEFNLPQDYRIDKNTPVSLEIPSMNKTIKGKIKWISDFLDPVSKTYNVVAVFPNHNQEIKPGMFVRVNVLLDTKKCIALPDESVLGITKKYVFTTKGKKAHLTPVKTGISDGFYTEIVQGIQAGDTVLVKGQSIVKDGSPIKVEGAK